MDYKGDIFYITQVLNGNNLAFNYLVEKHKDRVYNLAFRICGNREDAEEAAQDAFLKAFKSLKGFRMRSSFSTWLYRIVYNSSVSSVRTRKNNLVSIEEFPADYNDFTGINTSEEEAERDYRNALINFALQKIDEEERGLITLRYYEDMSIEEISEATGIGKSAVKVKLFRARAKMLETIEKVEKRKGIYHEQER
jgi:RNA polymerase sigma factor (sigma-70 family)